jgi:hypothetical protein
MFTREAAVMHVSTEMVIGKRMGVIKGVIYGRT